MLTEQKKSDEVEKERDRLFLQLGKIFVKNELKDFFCSKFLVLQMTVTKCNISKNLLYF